MSDESTETTPQSQTKTPLLNRTHVKKLALACAQNRARKFSRVSNDFFVAAEANLRNWVSSRVANAPSLGITLK